MNITISDVTRLATYLTIEELDEVISNLIEIKEEKIKIKLTNIFDSLYKQKAHDMNDKYIGAPN